MIAPTKQCSKQNNFINIKNLSHKTSFYLNKYRKYKTLVNKKDKKIDGINGNSAFLPFLITLLM